MVSQRLLVISKSPNFIKVSFHVRLPKKGSEATCFICYAFICLSRVYIALSELSQRFSSDLDVIFALFGRQFNFIRVVSQSWAPLQVKTPEVMSKSSNTFRKDRSPSLNLRTAKQVARATVYCSQIILFKHSLTFCVKPCVHFSKYWFN